MSNNPFWFDHAKSSATYTSGRVHIPLFKSSPTFLSMPPLIKREKERKRMPPMRKRGRQRQRHYILNYKY